MIFEVREIILAMCPYNVNTKLVVQLHLLTQRTTQEQQSLSTLIVQEYAEYPLYNNFAIYIQRNIVILKSNSAVNRILKRNFYAYY